MKAKLTRSDSLALKFAAVCAAAALFAASRPVPAFPAAEMVFLPAAGFPLPQHLVRDMAGCGRLPLCAFAGPALPVYPSFTFERWLLKKIRELFS